jgi:MraZ protein
MFRGSYFYNMDNKGRISIPARYREILHERQDRQVILTNFEGYILGFAESEWLKIEAKLGEQVIFDEDVRASLRFLISGVEECPLDRMGRILIPPKLRDYAKLTREVVLVGAIGSFEIWDRQAYETHRNQSDESLRKEVFKKLAI